MKTLAVVLIISLANNVWASDAVDEALAIHDRLIERFEGTTGIRDKGLLESALFRPQTGYYNDIAELAAALFESLIISHAFVDGNQRAWEINR